MKLITIVIGPLQNNCYILSGDGKNAVIIDAPGNFTKIEEALKEAGLSPAYVLLTHGHFDHVGAAKRLQGAGAKIYLHPDDTDMTGSGLWRVKSFSPDFAMSDGQALNLAGLKITVIHTPGHTSGGVCFLTSGMLFSGDTLFCGGIGRTDLPSGNHAQLKSSIKEKLFTLPPETEVFPGHGEKTSIGNEKGLLF